MIIIIAVAFATGCSKTTFVIKQTFGQLGLELRARDNEKVLKDKTVSEDHKEKIRKIQRYKKFYYDYFSVKPTPIYDETTFLKDKAVSYLVIASPIDKVEPIKHWFPFAGTFPYLGFFSKNDANDFQKDLSKQYFTYVRPVYAYSTLNRLPFYDNILSSFFEYSDFNLAELIFHELTHTIFFVDGDVNFNESFAEYIGEELAQDYFDFDEEKKQLHQQKHYQKKQLKKIIHDFVVEYNEKLEQEKPKTKKEALALMRYLHLTKYNKIYISKCMEFKRENCKWDINKWNNARMAEFLTYQSKQSLVEKIREKYNFSLKELLEYFKEKEKEFDDDKFKNFTSFIKHEEKL